MVEQSNPNKLVKRRGTHCWHCYTGDRSKTRVQGDIRSIPYAGDGNYNNELYPVYLLCFSKAIPFGGDS